jgi:hypothetical protein
VRRRTIRRARSQRCFLHVVQVRRTRQGLSQPGIVDLASTPPVLLVLLVRVVALVNTSSYHSMPAIMHHTALASTMPCTARYVSHAQQHTHGSSSSFWCAACGCSGARQRCAGRGAQRHGGTAGDSSTPAVRSVLALLLAHFLLPLASQPASSCASPARRLPPLSGPLLPPRGCRCERRRCASGVTPSAAAAIRPPCP